MFVFIFKKWDQRVHTILYIIQNVFTNYVYKIAVCSCFILFILFFPIRSLMWVWFWLCIELSIDSSQVCPQILNQFFLATILFFIVQCEFLFSFFFFFLTLAVLLYPLSFTFHPKAISFYSLTRLLLHKDRSSCSWP